MRAPWPRGWRRSRCRSTRRTATAGPWCATGGATSTRWPTGSRDDPSVDHRLADVQADHARVRTDPFDCAHLYASAESDAHGVDADLARAVRGHRDLGHHPVRVIPRSHPVTGGSAACPRTTMVFPPRSWRRSRRPIGSSRIGALEITDGAPSAKTTGLGSQYLVASSTR